MRTIARAALSGLAFMGVLGGILFVSAGSWGGPVWWVYLALWTATAVVAPFVVDPGLFRERVRPGPGGKDYFTAILLGPLWLGQYVVAGLDVGRFHWSDTVPLALQIAGLVVVAAGLAVVVWATAINRFFSSVIRIQRDRGHHVITTGPYRFVRHPGYAAALLLFVGGGLALGSWLAVLAGALMCVPILRRTLQEDRTLRQELEGYAQYAEKVRYRLIPGLW
jgi:protein-S-isoprenylcysteine O-methyltransferase Ste14